MTTPIPDNVRKYLHTQITTSSREKAVCIVHEECSKFLHQSSELAKDKRRPLLDKVQNMLVLLQRSLMINDPLSKSLLYIYDYCYVLLEEPTTENLTNALKLIDTLRDTFNQLNHVTEDSP